MKFDAVEFGKRVRGLRTAEGMTQEKLAEKLGINKQHVCRMETGARACSLELLVELSVVLHTTTDYLLMGKGVTLDMEDTANTTKN